MSSTSRKRSFSPTPIIRWDLIKNFDEVALEEKSKGDTTTKFRKDDLFFTTQTFHSFAFSAKNFEAESTDDTSVKGVQRHLIDLSDGTSVDTKIKWVHKLSWNCEDLLVKSGRQNKRGDDEGAIEKIGAVIGGVRFDPRTLILDLAITQNQFYNCLTHLSFASLKTVVVPLHMDKLPEPKGVTELVELLSYTVDDIRFEPYNDDAFHIVSSIATCNYKQPLTGLKTLCVGKKWKVGQPGLAGVLKLFEKGCLPDLEVLIVKQADINDEVFQDMMTITTILRQKNSTGAIMFVDCNFLDRDGTTLLKEHYLTEKMLELCNREGVSLSYPVSLVGPFFRSHYLLLPIDVSRAKMAEYVKGYGKLHDVLKQFNKVVKTTLKGGEDNSDDVPYLGIEKCRLLILKEYLCNLLNTANFPSAQD